MYDKERGCVRGKKESKAIKAIRFKLNIQESLVNVIEKAEALADTAMCIHDNQFSCFCKERQSLRRVISKARQELENEKE